MIVLLILLCPSNFKMLHIKSILIKKHKKAALSKNIENDIICSCAQKIIQKSAPEVEVLFYKNKTLYLKCPNSALANELFLKQEKLKEKINKFFKQKTVERLIVRTQ